MVRSGASVQSIAHERVTSVTLPVGPTTAIAVGSVLHFPPETVTRGAVIYPDHHPFVGITAIVPVGLETAVDPVPKVVLKAIDDTCLSAISILALNTGFRVQFQPLTVTVGLDT